MNMIFEQRSDNMPVPHHQKFIEYHPLDVWACCIYGFSFIVRRSYVFHLFILWNCAFVFFFSTFLLDGKIELEINHHRNGCAQQQKLYKFKLKKKCTIEPQEQINMLNTSVG